MLRVQAAISPLPRVSGHGTANPSFPRQLDIVGSDLENYGCPACGCSDRERRLFMFFDRLKFWDVMVGAAILHVAAEAGLREAILLRRPERYVAGTLHPSDEKTQRVDVTAMEFPDRSFDVVICNHVMEHVPDDAKAMREIYRVLKKGGRAVLQAPYSNVLAKSFEDPNISTAEARLKFYGQSDHVRIYGLDYFSRLEAAGFAVTRYDHRAMLAEFDSRVFGVNPREDLVLVTRN